MVNDPDDTRSLWVKAGYGWYESWKQWLLPRELLRLGLAVCSGGEIRVVDDRLWKQSRLTLQEDQERAFKRAQKLRQEEQMKDESLFQQAAKQELAPVQQHLT